MFYWNLRKFKSCCNLSTLEVRGRHKLKLTEEEERTDWLMLLRDSKPIFPFTLLSILHHKNDFSRVVKGSESSFQSALDVFDDYKKWVW